MTLAIYIGILISFEGMSWNT